MEQEKELPTEGSSFFILHGACAPHNSDTIQNSFQVVWRTGTELEGSKDLA
ncbi:hypothetical protein NCCP2716_00260 [Sporosarcina sp. NCCP-2716]|nr:hypothetical protein NCCP2716_00260 [Sporosarcina sp. NCCP-2716]